MNRRLTTPIILVIATSILIGLAPPVRAQGLIIDPTQIEQWAPRQPIGAWPVQPITLERESIEIDLDDQFAHVRITQVFRNNTAGDLEGTYVFPLPAGADISDFALWLDGRELTAETLPADEAAQIYHQIVSSMRDPGLLEYLGDGLIQAHIYPIPGNGTKQVDMEYDWLIPLDGDLIRIDTPLRLDGYSIDRIDTLAISVRIDSPDTLGTIYSPTHDVHIDRQGSTGATVSFEQSSHRPSGDFVLYISRPEGPVGLNMLTHSTGDDEGYFLAMIAPEYDESGIAVVPKDFVCVLDTSGSMAGQKIEQAKEALEFIFRNLNPEDRFQLITFATDIYPYFDGWSDASRGNMSDVREFIRGIHAGGSTNIDGALSEALSFRGGEGRPMYVIFLTDGLPTIGMTNTAQIIENFNTRNSEASSRVFCFGVGDDVDYQFIDRLARENGGYTSNVAPDEDLEQPLSDFYSKISSPVMTGIDVEISGARIYDMLPTDLPDLFLGSQLIIAGRFVGNGDGSVRIRGMVGEDNVRYSYPVEFTDERSNDFIPRHWATRRVGYLLNQIRLYGENQETVDEVVQLARRHGIITPYTSMLVTEDEMQVPRPGGEWDDADSWAPGAERERGSGGGSWLDSLFGFGSGGAGSPVAPDSGAINRLESRALETMEESPEAMMHQTSRETVRYAGDKTFYIDQDGYWVDSEFADSGLEPRDIEYLSEEYYQLMSDEPGIADYLTVAERMIVVWDDVAYRIEPLEGEVDPDAWRSADPGDDPDSGSGNGGSKGFPLTGYALIVVLAAIAGIVAFRRRK